MSGRRARSLRPLTAVLAAAAVLTMLGLVTTVVYRSGADTTDQPTAPATAPTSEQPSEPAKELDPTDRLPSTDDLVLDGNEWTEGDTYISTGPPLPEAACVTAADLNALSTTAKVGRRDFSGSVLESRLTAWVLEYSGQSAAKQAVSEIEQHLTACVDRQVKSSGPHQVPTEVGTARYYEVLAAVEASGDGSGEGIWNSVGLVRSGNRVEVISLSFRATEDHVEHGSTGDTGLPQHPLRKIMPNAAAHLD